MVSVNTGSVRASSTSLSVCSCLPLSAYTLRLLLGSPLLHYILLHISSILPPCQSPLLPAAVTPYPTYRLLLSGHSRPLSVFLGNASPSPPDEQTQPASPTPRQAHGRKHTACRPLLYDGRPMTPDCAKHSNFKMQALVPEATSSPSSRASGKEATHQLLKHQEQQKQ